MRDLLVFVIGLLIGGGFTSLLWRTIILPRTIWEMRDLGLIQYNDEVINAYRRDQ